MIVGDRQVWGGAPDGAHHSELDPWLSEVVRAVASEPWSRDPNGFAVTTPVGSDGESALGWLGDDQWRRHLAAILAADWVCYPHDPDRVAWHHLVHAMYCFPQGFRVWWGKSASGAWLPVGYTAWHPISLQTWEAAPALTDRFLVPSSEFDPRARCAYLFNVSIIPKLHRTMVSSEMMWHMRASVQSLCPVRLCAITVSSFGERLSADFGMVAIPSSLTHDRLFRTPIDS